MKRHPVFSTFAPLDRRTFLTAVGATIGGHLLSPRLAEGSPLDRESIVRIREGRLRGVNKNGVHVFLGVPYAASPAGPRRFQPPAALQPWSGVRDALAFGPRAPQPLRPMIPEIGDALTGSGQTGEDCLCLNLWTADPRPTARRPVVVYFHGGGFRSGSANSIFYDGAALAQKHGVVFIAVNHRLNAFGFLYLAEIGGARYAQSGNAGLLDLVAALRWVKSNVAGFGGDPDNVTIMGQSGGGGKAAMLTGMPDAKGLFHRAIIMSTLVESGVRALDKRQASAAAERLLAKLGVSRARLDALHEMPVQQIINALSPNGVASGTQPGNAGDGDISTLFSAVVDGTSLPAHPFDPAASALSADVPIICGSNETEGVPYADLDDPFWKSEVTSIPALQEQVQRRLSIDAGEAQRVIALYQKNRPNDSPGTLALIIAADNTPTRLASYLMADRKHALGRAPAYLYSFKWRSPVRGGKLRTMHSMELGFLFDHPDEVAFMVGSGADRYPLAKTMSTAFMTFARTGRPGGDGVPAWAPYNPVTRPTMVFDVESRLIDDPHGEERRALEAIRQARAARS